MGSLLGLPLILKECGYIMFNYTVVDFILKLKNKNNWFFFFLEVNCVLGESSISFSAVKLSSKHLHIGTGEANDLKHSFK